MARAGPGGVMTGARRRGPAPCPLGDWPRGPTGTAAWEGGEVGEKRGGDAPDGAEKANERGGGADRGQYRQARLQAGRECVDAVAQAAGDPVAHVELVVQVGLGVAVVG